MVRSKAARSVSGADETRLRPPLLVLRARGDYAHRLLGRALSADGALSQRVADPPDPRGLFLSRLHPWRRCRAFRRPRIALCRVLAAEACEVVGARTARPGQLSRRVE